MSDWVSIKHRGDNELGSWYDIQFEGMSQATTVIRQPSESVEQLIDRTRKKYSARVRKRLIKS